MVITLCSHVATDNQQLQMNSGFRVARKMKKSVLELNGKCIAKLCYYPTHREQGGRLVIQPGNTYVIVVGRYYSNEKIDFILRILADGPITFEYV